MALFVMVTGVSAEGGLVPALILSLITAGVGAIVMWMGILLFQSASKAQEATLTAQKYALISALNQNAKFFKIWGITIAIALLLYGLVVVLAISGVMGTALLSGFGPRGGLEMIESEVPGIEDISPDDQLDEDDMMEDDGLEIMDQNELDDGATEEDSDSN